MVEDRGSNRRPRLLQLGPAWITAIAGLITALTAAGFFAGRATAPAGPPPTTTSAAPLVPPGTALTHYTVDLSDTYGTNFTDKPARPQRSNGSDLDLFYHLGQFNLGGHVQGASLDRAPPTYDACVADTRYAALLSVDKGSTFCITVGGLLAGITVTNFVVTIFSYVTLDITVWQGTGAGS